ncbi:hypothetical protein CEQ21_07780 (plasmid) [Niallia circulans]|uniref:Uncharacterized protein n=1 Tax=Niallia circulans TaxID=1397 RepID=A0A553SQJ8_NIACI|nr:hypothetical protein CEQ21_07780 [Niallia circulans]
MFIITMLMAFFVFSIFVLIFTFIMCWRSREVFPVDILRFKGALIMLVSTGILLILKEKVINIYNTVSTYISNLNTLLLIILILVIIIGIVKVRYKDN